MLTYTNQVKTAATSLPLSLSEAKEQIGIAADSTSNDGIVLRLIKAATADLQKATGWQFMEATLIDGVTHFPANFTDQIAEPLVLQVYEATELNQVSYEESEGGTVIDITADVELVAGGWPSQVQPVYGKQWPTDASGRRNAVSIDYTAKSDESTMHVAKIAIAQIVADWFLFRTNESDKNIYTVPSMEALVRNLKVGLDYEEYPA